MPSFLGQPIPLPRVSRELGENIRGTRWKFLAARSEIRGANNRNSSEQSYTLIQPEGEGGGGRAGKFTILGKFHRAGIGARTAARERLNVFGEAGRSGKRKKRKERRNKEDTRVHGGARGREKERGWKRRGRNSRQLYRGYCVALGARYDRRGSISLPVPEPELRPCLFY